MTIFGLAVSAGEVLKSRLRLPAGSRRLGDAQRDAVGGAGKRMIVVDLGSQECAALPQPWAVLGDSAVVMCPMAPAIAARQEVFVSSLPRRRARGGPTMLGWCLVKVTMDRGP